MGNNVYEPLQLIDSYPIQHLKYRGTSNIPKASPALPFSSRQFSSSAMQSNARKEENALYKGKYLDLQIDSLGSRRQL